MISLNSLDALVFDFDGVLTDNHVYVGEDGREFVRCSRGDGLAFNELKQLGIKCFIISSEKNKVVAQRAKKLNIPVLYGVTNKVKALKEICVQESLDLSRIIYIGNDLNDFKAMSICGYSACPSDSHPRIKDLATFQLKNKGGSGIVRELIEEIFNVDVITILYSN